MKSWIISWDLTQPFISIFGSHLGTYCSGKIIGQLWAFEKFVLTLPIWRVTLHLSSGRSSGDPSLHMVWILTTMLIAFAVGLSTGIVCLGIFISYLYLFNRSNLCDRLWKFCCKTEVTVVWTIWIWWATCMPAGLSCFLFGSSSSSPFSVGNLRSLSMSSSMSP